MPDDSLPALRIQHGEAIKALASLVKDGEQLTWNLWQDSTYRMYTTSTEPLFASHVVAEYDGWQKVARTHLQRMFGDGQLLAEFSGFTFDPHLLTFWESVRCFLAFRTREARYALVEQRRRLIERQVAILKAAQQYVPLCTYHADATSIISVRETPAITSPDPTRQSRVFIVHGHDNAAKQSAARLVEKLDCEAVILHEQPNKGRTIIEKFEGHSFVDFAIVLLTPDDFGGSNATPTVQYDRARQNVVFELGYFFGLLKRGRVCALVKGGVEKPSDIDGVVYIQMDDHEAWRMTVAKEMKAAGLPVSLDKL